MSSETKSRVGLREAIEQVMKLYAGHGDGNPPEYGLPTLRKAWREVRTALESSSSADPGGREASNHARGAGRRQRLRELLYPKIVDDKLIADWMWREIDRIDEGLREPGADTGTTGAEGLDARLDEAKWWDENCGFPGRGAKLRADRIASLEAQRAATQRAPVMPPLSVHYANPCEREDCRKLRERLESK